jgi:hypothetical protein
MVTEMVADFLAQPPVYLPFMDTSKHLKVGLKALSLVDWLEIDATFQIQLAEKERLLGDRHQDVFVSLPDTQAAQQEVLDLVSQHLLQYFPNLYQQRENGFSNRVTNQHFDLSTFAQAPLDLAGRLVQEDLCLLLPGATGYVLAAASVCFPLRWCLREKLGQPIEHIHQHVPGYAQKLARPVNSVFDRMQQQFPGVRFNWSVVDAPDLFLDQSKHITTANPAITAENAGQSLWLRVERQTLRRLPNCGGILFTIRTYIYPLEQITQTAEVATQLAQAIQSLHPEMQVYKNLLPFRAALLTYLDHRSHQPASVSAPRGSNEDAAGQ